MVPGKEIYGPDQLLFLQVGWILYCAMKALHHLEAAGIQARGILDPAH